MFYCPLLRIIYDNLVDQSIGGHLLDRDSDPFESGTSLDFVSVSPVLLSVLNIIMEYENVAFLNNMKIPFPGYI
jgi:hypothetical protein